MSIDGVHTCITPLASGSSHVSVFNAVHNAKILGLEHDITNVEVLELVNERLTASRNSRIYQSENCWSMINEGTEQTRRREPPAVVRKAKTFFDFRRS